MSRTKLKIQRASIYGLTREKRKKKVSDRWILNKTKLTSKTYSVLSTFLYKNIAILMNLPEIPRIERQMIHPPIHLEGGDPRKERSRAHIASFIDRRKGRSILDRLRISGDDISFSNRASKISQRFLDVPFWPKTYLFVLQFLIRHSSFSEEFAGILTTKLRYGQLAEDPRRVIHQMKTGIIGERVKKAAIYPHISKRRGKITTEPYAKVYEDTQRPAKYFYRFLQLDYPLGLGEFVESLYNEELCEKDLSLEEFIELLREEDPELLNQVEITTMIDNIEIFSSLSDFYDKMRFTKIAGRKHLVLVKGSKVSALLGKHDLFKDGKIKSMDKKTLIRKVLKGKKA